MAEHKFHSRPAFVEVRFTDCPHVVRWEGYQLVHGTDCKVHCFICKPESAEQPLKGLCPDCSVERSHPHSS